MWWIDFYDQDRKRVQESSHSSIRRDAEALVYATKIGNSARLYKRPVKITFGEFGKRYMEYAKANKRSWLRDEQMLEQLYNFFGKERHSRR